MHVTWQVSRWQHRDPLVTLLLPAQCFLPPATPVQMLSRGFAELLCISIISESSTRDSLQSRDAMRAAVRLNSTQLAVWSAYHNAILITTREAAGKLVICLGFVFFLVYFFAWINIQLQFEQQRIFHWYFRWKSLLELLFIIFKYFTICDRRVRFFFIWTPKGMSILITEYILMLIFQNVRHENAHRAFFIFSCKLTVKLQALQQKLPVLLPLQ